MLIMHIVSYAFCYAICGVLNFRIMFLHLFVVQFSYNSASGQYHAYYILVCLVFL